MFHVCEKCNKKLIERLPNGLWRFKFGSNGKGDSVPVVDMTIQGSLQLKCLRRSCAHVSTFNYFPDKQVAP